MCLTSSPHHGKARLCVLTRCIVLYFLILCGFVHAYMYKCLVRTNNVEMPRCAHRLMLCAHYAAKSVAMVGTIISYSGHNVVEYHCTL